MAASKFFYELSRAADADLVEIFDYTAGEFGDDQAVSYLRQIDEAFSRLLDNPRLGRERSEIREELHSLAEGGHVIFYRILKDRIRIVRVLHGSRDLPRFFSTDTPPG